jgi:hypothetical protein
VGAWEFITDRPPRRGAGHRADSTHHSLNRAFDDASSTSAIVHVVGSRESSAERNAKSVVAIRQSDIGGNGVMSSIAHPAKSSERPVSSIVHAVRSDFRAARSIVHAIGSIARLMRSIVHCVWSFRRSELSIVHGVGSTRRRELTIRRSALTIRRSAVTIRRSAVTIRRSA